MNIIEFAVVITKPNSLPSVPTGSSEVGTILQIVFMIFGAVAVLVVTLAGLKYTISRGDPQATGKAKDTILYAVIGLVVSVLAYAIVTFVIKGVT